MARPVRREPYSLRWLPDERRLIDAAAKAVGEPMSELVRTAALREARQILARLADGATDGSTN